MVAPCTPWTTTADIELCGADLTGVDPGLIDAMIAAAGMVISHQLGNRFDTCTETVRPCGDPRWPRLDCSACRGLSAGTVEPTRLNGEWFNFACQCHSYAGCTCLAGEQRIYLGQDFIQAVTEVRLEAGTLAPANYQLVENYYLLRTDGNPWPCCDTDFEIDITYGEPLPPGANVFAGQLAWEYLKACNPSLGECELPERVVSVTRQGTTLNLIDPQDFINEGLTGLTSVDIWVNALNPQRLQRRAYAVNPRKQTPVRRFT